MTRDCKKDGILTNLTQERLLTEEDHTEQKEVPNGILVATRN